jgi:hypothetical protein
LVEEVEVEVAGFEVYWALQRLKAVPEVVAIGIAALAWPNSPHVMEVVEAVEAG